MASTHTRWSFPQAVPSSTLSFFFFFFFFENEVVVSERKKTLSLVLPLSLSLPQQTSSPSKNPLTASVVVHARLGQHGVVLDLRLAHGGQLFGMITSFPLPPRRHLSVVLRPSVNLPDLTTSASLELMFSWDFFCLGEFFGGWFFVS